MKLPEKIYFHIAQSDQHGWYIRETPLYCWELEHILSEIDDDTVAVLLLEDGIESDVSEDVAIAWFKANEDEISVEDDGEGNIEALVSDFIRNHASEQIAQLEGKIATERMNNRQHAEHIYAA